MKKILALLLTVALSATLLVAIVGCGNKEDKVIALITLHDENSSYDKNFIDSFEAACKAKGLTKNQYAIVTNIAEDADAVKTEAANFASQGYKAVCADSFGHEAGMVAAAKEFTDVQFCHATGTQACMEKLANYHNAFASIYEGRYLAGIAAGMWLNANSPENHKVGYVGAFPYAEVISGMTSFFLGVKSVCEDATLYCKFTNSWYNPTREKETAQYLINTDGVALVSGHADSDGVPNACEEKNIPNVFYNGTHNKSVYLASCRINWQVYYEHVIDCVLNGTAIEEDYVGTLANGSVEVLPLGSIAATGTQAKIDEAAAKLKNGTLNVFDCSKFTVGGNALTEYLADARDDGTFTPETNVIANGIFEESKYRSAPYFDIIIDGVTNHGASEYEPE